MSYVIDKLRYVKNCILRPRIINSYGVKLQVGPHINSNIRRFMYHGWYEKQEIAILDKVLDPADVVLEIGGGLGFLASYCAKRLGNENVFTVEANPSLLELMKENFRLNGVSPSLFNVVLSTSAGKVDFYIEDSFWSSSTIRRGDQARRITVEKCRFDEFYPQTKANFLVVDIEGGELDLIPEINLDFFDKILIELHPHIIGNAGVSKVVQALVNNHFVADPALSDGNVFFYSRQRM